MNKYLTIIILIPLAIIIYNLATQVFSALQAGQRIDIAVEELSVIQRKNSELKLRLKEVSSPEFIEQQARDKLNFAREGEVIVVIPEEELNKVLGAAREKAEEVIPNWQGWLKLFFK